MSRKSVNWRKMTTPELSSASARFTQIARGEQPLHHELIRAVGGHGEEGATDDAGPEGVSLVVRFKAKLNMWNLPAAAATE